jgi:hypothetical protein
MQSVAWHRTAICAALAAAATLITLPAQAIDVGIESLGLEGTLNNTFTVGAQMRMEHRAVDLIGKANLDQGVCAGIYQSCQGLFKDQIYPSIQLRDAPGAPSMRADNGDLNYDRRPRTGGCNAPRDRDP